MTDEKNTEREGFREPEDVEGQGFRHGEPEEVEGQGRFRANEGEEGRFETEVEGQPLRYGRGEGEPPPPPEESDEVEGQGYRYRAERAE